MMKYLILGDGKLASELHKKTKWNYVSRKKDNFNFTDIDSYTHFLEDYEQIINCIGYTKTYENERKLNWDINYVGVIHLVNHCNEHNKKLIHISTDYVYANSTKGRSEEDIPVHFESWYTYTKLLADGYIQAISKNYLLFRTNFKPYPFPWDKAWDDIIGNFDYVDIIAELMINLIEKSAEGLYNIGTDSKTYYDLAAKSVPTCIKDKSGEFNHPSDVTMNLSKMRNKLKE